MIEREAALEVAARHAPAGLAVNDASSRELPSGWFFAFRAIGGPMAGAQGLIVNKRTGAVFHLGSAFPIDRDLELYERGYQYASYDLVVTQVSDVGSTIATLEQIGIAVVEPSFENGTVWRIPRRLTRDELRSRLQQLPSEFGNVSLYFHAEALEQARVAGAFVFELLESSVR